MTRVSFDTNVVACLATDDDRKSEIAQRLLMAGGVLSVQVLDEFASLAVRKRNWPLAQVREFLAAVRSTCEIVPLTVVTHDLGLVIAERHKLHIYDALIVAAAALAGCTTLYSEDMRHGLVIDGVTVRNPFR